MSCANFNHDQTSWVYDFGPKGQVAKVNLNLAHGFQPGGSVGGVILADQNCDMTIYDVYGNYFNINMKVGKGVSAYSKIDGKWAEGSMEGTNGIRKGVRSSIVLVYEKDGYRIFVNGKEELFYKHQCTNPATSVEFTNCQVFKVIYYTSMAIVP